MNDLFYISKRQHALELFCLCLWDYSKLTAQTLLLNRLLLVSSLLSKRVLKLT